MFEGVSREFVVETDRTRSFSIDGPAIGCCVCALLGPASPAAAPCSPLDTEKLAGLGRVDGTFTLTGASGNEIVR